MERLKALGLAPQPVQLVDEVVLRRQMGHRPRLALAVLRRCRWGYPQVLLFAPLLVGQRRISPNSTLCWLSCPLLVGAVDRLEADREIERFEHLASVDAELRAALEQAHRETARIRRALLPEEWERKLEQERPREHWVITQTGIAGITRPDHVKCLHAHLADYMVRGSNPVGEEVARRLESEGTPLQGTDQCWRYCSPEGAWEHLDLRGGSGGQPAGDGERE
ncbi:MAG TPA: DUF501 domain-containing protein [Limnochordales bacterium]